jgi:hypothetical protein
MIYSSPKHLFLPIKKREKGKGKREKGKGKREEGRVGSFRRQFITAD